MKRLLAILLLFSAQQLFANIIIVGKGKVITSIKKAIASANNGDTILLHKGIYREGNLLIDKSLFLIGVDEPVLDGEDKYEILTLTGKNIVVRGIAFRNSGYSAMNDQAAVSIIDAENVIIENNTIINSYFAIHVANARYCLIRNNAIRANPKTEQTSGNGIHLWKCEKIIVEDNEIRGHRDGIYFEFVNHSSIQNNLSENNIRYGLHFMFSNNNAYMQNTFRKNGAGVAVMYSGKIVMQKNNFELNWGANAYGLLLKEISDAAIIENTFSHNTIAILMESTNRLDVAMNKFERNGWALRIQASCNENEIHHNNFTGNTFDIATNGTLALNRFLYNYWDKYEGYDMNKDLIGDVPCHPISMYSMVIEHNPNAVILLRSFMVSLLEKAEKAIPSLTPIDIKDEKPFMKPLQL